MKEIIRKSIITIVCFLILAYLYFLFQNNQIIATEAFLTNNNLFYLLLTLIPLYFLIFFVILKKYPAKHKIIGVLLWIITILFSKFYLINDGLNGQFVGDIFTIIGIIIIWVSPTNLLINTKLKKKRDDKKVEIIEA